MDIDIMAKKKKSPEASRILFHPPSAEYPEGRYEEELTDGTRRFIDKNGDEIIPIEIQNKLAEIKDIQLEAWKKEPHEQALREALDLFRANGMDVAEQRVKLEIIKFISQVQGVFEIQNTYIQNTIAIKIDVADLPPGMKVINTKTVH